jgi:hypothetical protein
MYKCACIHIRRIISHVCMICIHTVMNHVYIYMHMSGDAHDHLRISIHTRGHINAKIMETMLCSYYALTAVYVWATCMLFMPMYMFTGFECRDGGAEVGKALSMYNYRTYMNVVLHRKARVYVSSHTYVHEQHALRQIGKHQPHMDQAMRK